MKFSVIFMALIGLIFVLGVGCGDTGSGDGDGDGDSDGDSDGDGDGDCTDGLARCGETCVDTSSDHDNCGGCGNACGDDQVCREGLCGCTGSGLEPCGRDCVNTASDRENCGACGTECPGDQSCLAGECVSCLNEEVNCDGRDDDCDDEIDEGLSRDCSNLCGDGVETCDAGTWNACTAPEPDDEVCDEVDNDCDGAIDEGVTNTYYEDYDADGYGTLEYSEQACEAFTHPTRGTAYIEAAGDCNDRDETINPDAAEICDEADNNCDGTIDEGCGCVDGRTQVCGGCDDGTSTCVGGEWGTCEGATTPVDETCDGVDNDCDGLIDDDLPMAVYWPEEPNEDCSTFSIASAPMDEGGSYTMSGYAYHGDLTGDVDVIRIDAREISDTLFCTLCCGTCGFPDTTETDTCYECMTLNVNLTEPADLDLEFCLNVTRTVEGTCDSPIQRICSNDGGATGDNVLLAWEGWCNRDDNLQIFVEVFPRSSGAPSSCEPYELSFDFDGEIPSDTACGPEFLRY